MDLSNLTPEQQERAKEFKSTEEFVKFVQDEGIELTVEQLEMVAGGSDTGDYWEAPDD